PVTIESLEQRLPRRTYRLHDPFGLVENVHHRSEPFGIEHNVLVGVLQNIDEEYLVVDQQNLRVNVKPLKDHHIEPEARAFDATNEISDSLVFEIVINCLCGE